MYALKTTVRSLHSKIEKTNEANRLLMQKLYIHTAKEGKPLDIPQPVDFDAIKLPIPGIADEINDSDSDEEFQLLQSIFPTRRNWKKLNQNERQHPTRFTNSIERNQHRLWKSYKYGKYLYFPS